MLKSFLTAVLADSSLYCLAIQQKFTNEEGEQIVFFKHKVFESIDKLIAASEIFDAQKNDVFFAVGTLKQKGIFNEKKNKTEVRTHENMDRFNAFILDIDCGEGKPYLTKQDGSNALKTFCVQSGMPKPFIIDSGGGLHVYWAFEDNQGTTADYWYNCAAQFKKITEFYKLNADPSRTSDRSSVLRMPGTHNYKQVSPRQVRVLVEGVRTPLIDLVNIFEKNIAENDIDIPLKKPSAFDGIASNLTTSFAKADAAAIFRKCKQMAYVKEVGGPVGYTMRASAVSIIKCCDVEDYSILWANDPNVSTVKRQTEMQREDSITNNPHTCERIEGQNPGGCNGCKNKGSVYFKSPVTFGKPIQEAQVVEEDASDDLSETEEASPTTRPMIAPNYESEEVSIEPKKKKEPKSVTVSLIDGTRLIQPKHPFKLGSEGQIYLETEDTQEMVYEHPILPYERVWDAHTNCEMIRIKVKLPQDGWREIYTELYNLVEPRAFNKVMATTGIICGGNDKTQQLCTYMNLYLQHIQKTAKATKNYPQLGWLNDRDVFVLPTKSIHKDGSIENCGVSTALKHAVSSFRKQGTLEEWKKVINTYNRPGYEPYAFGHLVGYGSLLFQFTNYHGAIVNMVGDSGSGKSTVLQTINSLFGHPDESMLTQIDTLNSKMNRLGVFNSICATYDEITNIDAEELSALCYSVSQGRAKHRLGQDATEKENTTRWKMILASTSNSNLMLKLSTLKQDASAESLRIFEYYINRQDKMTRAEAGDIFDKLQDNFGHAGEIFINEVIGKQDKTRELIKEMTRTFEERAEVPVKERYWSAIVGCAIAGGMIAKKLGLCDFDIPHIMSWAVHQVRLMRAVVDENKRDPRALLVDYLNSIVGNTLVIGGGIDKDKGMYVREEVKGALLARSEIDAGVLYLSKSALRQWLTKGGTDYNWVKKTLTDNKILLRDNIEKVLTVGSNMAKTGQTRCWMIDLNHPQMAGVTIKAVTPLSMDRANGFGVGNV